MKTVRSRLMVASCLTAMAWAGAGSVYAQQAAKPTTGTQLEELVVTARKREENILAVPVAISSLNAENLRNAGVANLEQMTSQVPGLVYVERQDRNSSTPGIRGVRSTEIANNRQKVTTFFDGMPILGNQAVSNFTDVDRVEVYRGPQSAQFGRAVFAGAINYYSRKVDYNQYTGSMTVDLGEHNRQGQSLLLSGPIVKDKLGLLVSANVDKWGGPGIVASDGVRLGNTRTFYASAKLGWKITDAVEANLRYLHSETQDGPSTLHYLDINSPQRVLLPGANPLTNSKTVIGEVDFSLPDNYVFRRNFCFPGASVRTGTTTQVAPANCVDDPGQSTLRNRWSLDVGIDLGTAGNGVLKGFTSSEFDQRKDDGDNSDLVPYANGVRLVIPVTAPQDPTQITEKYLEGEYLSPNDKPLRLTAGASYYHYNFHTTIFGNRSANLIQQLFDEITTNTGIYGSAFYDITDRMTASVEARYQIDDITSSSALSNQSFSSKTKTLLPRFAVTYKLQEDMNIYAQVAKGNNPSGINIDVLTPNKQAVAAALGNKAQLDNFLKFEEESLWNYEVGVKGLFFNRRLRSEMALFDMEWNNYVQPYNFSIGTAGSVAAYPTASDYNSRVFVNSGKLRSRGLELSGEFRATQALRLEGAFSYTHARYVTNCSPGLVQYGLPVFKTTPVACVDSSGKSPPLLPAYMGSLAATLDEPIGGGWRWVNRADVNYTGRQYLDDGNRNWIGAKTVVNIRTSLRREKFQIDLGITNLTDNKTPGTAQANNDVRVPAANLALTGTSGTNISSPIARPREISARLSYRF